MSPALFVGGEVEADLWEGEDLEELHDRVVLSLRDGEDILDGPHGRLVSLLDAGRSTSLRRVSVKDLEISENAVAKAKEVLVAMETVGDDTNHPVKLMDLISVQNTRFSRDSYV